MPQTTHMICRVLLLAWLLGLAHAAVAIEPAEDLLRALGARTRNDHALEQRVASILHKVGKTLILERTRGAKEIDVYRKAAPAVVLVVTNTSLGSGTILDGQGHILTSWHVVADSPYVVVMLKPQDSTALKKELAFRALVEKVDEVADLALLRMDTPPTMLPTVPLGAMASLAVGQDVHAIGHPEGEVWTYTKGIISQIRPQYRWSTVDGHAYQGTVIQTQTPINPGNSGGPLLDEAARMIGINAFRASGEGLNYAVAIDAIQAFLQRLGNRVSAPPPPPPQPRCTDTYDTKGPGGATIVGCYGVAATPPPDLWFIYRNPQRPAAYMALDSRTTGEIDTVIRSQDLQGQSLQYYIDADCNGTVDLIGYQRQGSATIDSYQVPPKPLRMVTLAKELDSAIKRHKIPYSKLRVCQ